MKAFVGKLYDLGETTPNSCRRAMRIAKRLYKKADADDKKILSEIISECEFVEEWLTTGRRPGNKRGVERLAAYQREVLVDPLKMQAYVSNSKAGSPSNLTDWQRFQIEDALSRLSDRERECYVLAHGECFSHSAIANMLYISKDSVSEYIDRAQKKISKDLESSLFLIQ
ncbi:sigma factor-like helix-turn-helix DNA-binding protein [Paenibacillus sp. FSL F4-0087]|uniref:sigma factor-like helix-turn-helix DNA-binding protein n=1 Tax=Paenibacillus sp. FSL F4-0087 TaxID=2921368 RepID=UPI00096F156C|nr:RNA polymerase subunit sigma-24 [Paenibacillus pabuli]